jgi:hypothetical protein
MLLLTVITNNQVKIEVWRSVPHSSLPFCFIVWCECLRCGDVQQMCITESQQEAIGDAMFLKDLFNSMEVERECRAFKPAPKAIEVYQN